MLSKKYVITGIGLNDSLGTSPNESFFHMVECSIIPQYKQILEKSVDIDLTRFGYTNKEIRRLTNQSIRIMNVVESSLIDADLDIKNIKNKNIPVVFSMSTRNISLDYSKFLSENQQRVNPYLALNFSSDFISNYIQSRYNLTGQSCTLSAACSTGLYSLDYAIKMMEEENSECAIVGTSSSGCNELDQEWFTSLGALSKSGISRPFDKDRDGFVMANGHACMIIETLEHAKNRNATIYAEIVGLGLANDGHNLTSPDSEMKGSKLALEKCLKNFNGNVDYINAHATSTPIGDDIEAKLMETYFPGSSINSNKGHLGHSIHSSNFVEIIHTIMAMKHSLIPHTANLENPLEANLDFVMHKPKEKTIHYALKNSFGFGGRNGFILLKNMML